ncbi:hypothetical protein CRG98_031593 [Punica granatum]|uniref:Uncharacterized protein n=1 Tax=Punica granatum TaxID=22663 RepID=A0A2I0IWG3_PUNGR|nr:hypothetical protein CRG98_031593 [Punica granatum]
MARINCRGENQRSKGSREQKELSFVRGKGGIGRAVAMQHNDELREAREEVTKESGDLGSSWGDGTSTIHVSACYIVEGVNEFDEIVETSPASAARSRDDFWPISIVLLRYNLQSFNCLST